jgi:hypothetical protein
MRRLIKGINGALDRQGLAPLAEQGSRQVFPEGLYGELSLVSDSTRISIGLLLDQIGLFRDCRSFHYGPPATHRELNGTFEANLAQVISPKDLDANESMPQRIIMPVNRMKSIRPTLSAEMHHYFKNNRTVDPSAVADSMIIESPKRDSNVVHQELPKGSLLDLNKTTSHQVNRLLAFLDLNESLSSEFGAMYDMTGVNRRSINPNFIVDQSGQLVFIGTSVIASGFLSKAKKLQNHLYKVGIERALAQGYFRGSTSS